MTTWEDLPGLGTDEAREFERNYGRFGEVERRSLGIVDIEWRQAENGRSQDMTVSGYASVFDRDSLDLGGFVERIAPGAFSKVLATRPDVHLTWDHDTKFVLARTTNKTLDLKEDGAGLRFWARVAPTSYADDLRILMERGDLDQASFLFTIARGGQNWQVEQADDGSERVMRTITEVNGLFDVTVTAQGAYPDATSALGRTARTLALAYANDSGMLTSRKAIPFKETPKAPTDTAWNGPAEVARADVHDLMAMCAWYDANAADDDGDGIPDAKSAFKLPHHRADGAHPVVWRGVAAAMGVLMGARGANLQIPDSDKRGVYNHLADHYKQFDKQPPEFRTLTADAEARIFTDAGITPEEYLGEERERIVVPDTARRLAALKVDVRRRMSSAA